ncbi:MAG: hypothetical protein SGJ17_14415 [Hyphomicrobiales bacterium]|nr:hypothetical protein [Hyphomicrobiales bacterium]
MKRALQNNDNWSLTFFSLYDVCLMDVAVISWWKIFGENKEALNWKRLVSVQLKNEFLQNNVGFDSIHADIKKYRDKYVAHHELNESRRPSHHPDLQPLPEAGL